MTKNPRESDNKPIDFSDKLSQILDLKPAVIAAFSRLNVETVRDLIFHLPSRYEDRSHFCPIAALQENENALIYAKVRNYQIQNARKKILLVEISDEHNDCMKLVFFRFFPSQIKQFISERKGIFFGKVSRSMQGYFQIAHPEITWLKDGQLPQANENLDAIYPNGRGLLQNHWRLAIDFILKKMQFPKLDLLKDNGFMSLEEALLVLHKPSVDSTEQFRNMAKKRIAMEELCAHRIALQQARKYLRSYPAIKLNCDGKLIESFMQSLSFSLTNAQKRVWQEISHDLSSNVPMLRLLQGDVGSGKTLIAILSCLVAAQNGLQSVFMAPTELLAEQHFNTFSSLISHLPINISLLTAKKKTKEKREILQDIHLGKAEIIIGTHALFQEQVIYKNLALVIIDEQHRFGVGQRLKLREKTSSGFMPHQLVLSATPIPRTLTMSNYGELDTSIIDELPKGRKEVRTSIISNDKRAQLIARISQQCMQGAQVYWVCPLIEESEQLECENAEETAQMLAKFMPHIRIAVVHSRVENQLRREIMADFASGKINLLVATTVIEVGVNVPNASLMIIENAERFGLSQLHQLRGRVGRGNKQSDCVLLYQAPLGDIAQRRLSIMRETTDGFRIAEEDLQLRGAGELLGRRQSGDGAFMVADLLKDNDLIEIAEKLAEKWTEENNPFCQILLSRWSEGKEKYLQV